MTRPSASNRRTALLARSALGGVLGAVALGAMPALAQVTGVGTITGTTSNGGAVGVTSGGGVTGITLGASRSIVNWNSLNVTPTEALNFYFANRGDIVLNRVAGAASIDGVLSGCMATCGTTGGNIWILSAGGVVIGGNAQISTGGFLASVGDVTNADFLDGDMNFAFTGPDEGTISVANGASIDTNGGSIALIAPTINTQAGSTVSAGEAGNVLYGSATNYNVTFAPTADNDLDLISFQVPAGADGAGGLYGGSITLGGATTGNRVYAAVVSRAGLTSTLLATGAITATSVGTDETGAIILSNNRNITGGVMSSSAVAGSGTGTLTNHGVLTAPSVTLAASGALLFSDDITAAGGSVTLRSDTGTVHQNDGEITASTLTVYAETDIVLAAGFDGDVNNVAQLTGLTSASGDISYAGGSFQIAGGINAPGVVGLSSTGTISGAGQISAGSISLSGQGAINVLGNANLLYSGSTGNLTIHATGGIAMTDGWDLNGHTLNLIADSGSIIQTGDAIYDGGTLIATATGDIDFGSQSNYVTTFGGNSSGGGDIAFRGNGTFALDATSTTGQLSLTSDGGHITSPGGINVGSLTASAAGSITLDGAIASVDDVTAGGFVTLSTYSTAMDLTGDVTGTTVTLYADTGVTQSGGKIDTGRLNVITTGAISLTGANEIDVVGRLDSDQFSSGTGGDITLRNVGNILLDYLVTAPGATVTFTSDTGAITQTNLSTITADRLIASAAGNITIYDGTNDVATIGGLSSTNGDIVYRDLDGFDLQGNITANSAITRGVMLVAGGTGAITQTSGVLDVGYFRGIAQSGITLGGANLIRRLITTVVSNGALTLNNVTDLSVDGTVSANTVSLTTTGAITQAANAQIWTTALNASAVIGINLTASGSGANNISNLGLITNTTSGGVAFSNATNMNLAGSIVASGQAVSITNTQGSINQTGGIIAADSLSLSATGGISATRNNIVSSLGPVTAGGNFAFTNVGNLYLSGNIDAGANTVSLTSNTGQIEQTGGVITANSLNLLTGGRIWLNNANAVSSLGVVTAGGHVLFRNDGNTVVGGDITAAGFDVTLRSNGGSVTQTAGSDITSNSLQVIAQTGVTLTNLGNAVGELSWATSASGGIAFGQTNGFLIGGPITAGGQTVSLSSANGAIGQISGSISAGALNASAAGTLTLNQGNNVDSLGVVSTGGNLEFVNVHGFDLTGNVTVFGHLFMVAENGSISQTGGIMSAGSIYAKAAVDLSLGGANQINIVSDLMAGNDLLYRQVGDLSVPTISAAGTVSLYSITGDITQTGTITADTLVLGAGDDITLGQNFVAKLGQIDASGDFTAANADGLSSGALELTDDITVGGAMTLVNPGAVTQTGGAITAGSLFIDTDGALTAAGANSITGATRLSALDATFNAAGDLTVQVNTTGFATITSTGAVVLDGVGASTGDTLNIQAVNGISQGAAGLDFTNFGNLTNTTAGGIDLTNSSWMTLNGAISAVNQAVALNVVSGGIIQLSGSNIAANRLSVTTTQGAQLGEMNQVAELGVINVGAHNFSFRTFGDLVIDGDITSALNVMLTSATGSITQTAGSDITAGGLSVWAETGINLTNAGNNAARILNLMNLDSGGIAYGQTNGILIDGTVRAWNQTVSLTSLAGGISETNNIFFPQIEAGTLNLSAGGAITLHRDNDINNLGVVSAVGGFTFNDVDGFNLTGAVTGGGAVVLDAVNGSIVQSGGVITATSIDAAASGNLDLGSANVVGAIAALTAGGDILYRQVGNLSAPAITATGSLSLYSTSGSITQTGALSAATFNAGAATGIALNDASNAFGALGDLTNTTSGGISVYEADGFNLTGAISTSAAQSVTLAAVNGAITQQGSATVETGILTVSATGGATLDGDNDVDTLGPIIVGPSFTFKDVDGFDIAGDLYATTTNLTSGGAITQSTGVLGVGTLSLTAASATLDGANDIDSLGNVDVAGNMSFSDVDAITLAGSQTVDGTLALTAGSFVDQLSGGIDVGRLEVDAASVFINLSGNAIDTVGDVTATTGSIFVINNNAGVALEIDGDVSAASGGQAVYISSLNSGVTMTGAGSIISGGNLEVRGGGNVVLGDINAGGVLTVVAGGGSVSSTAAPTIVAARLTGYATTGDFILTGANIDISEIGYIEVGNTFSITGNNGSLALSNNIIAEMVSLGTTGALAQIGGSLDATTGSFSAGGGLTLTNNNAVDTVSLNGASITYRNSGSFAANVLTSTGSVTLISTTGKITQTASTGRIVADSLTASAATGLEFYGGQNDIRVLAGLSSLGGGVTWRDWGGFLIAGDITAAGQTVELVSDGTGADGNDVAQTSGIITANRLQGTSAGDLLFNNANVVETLGYLNAVDAIHFRGMGNYALQGDINAGASLTLTSDFGSIQQFGGVIVADSFAGTAALGISLGRINDVDILGAVDAGAGDFNFRDADSLVIAGLITSDTGIVLQAGGDITQSSGSVVTGMLSVFADGGAYLDGSGNDIDSLGLSTGMTGLAFIDIDGFGINDRVFSTGTITLTATTGDIVETAGGYLSAQGLNVYANSGEIDLAGGNVIENVGDLMAGGDVTFHEIDGFTVSASISGDAVELTVADGAISQVGGFIVADSLLVSAVAGINLARSGNDVDTIAGLTTTGGGITYTDADSVNIAGAVTASGQTVTFNVGDDLTQAFTGVIIADMVQGTAGGDFALSDAINTFGQLGAISADRIAINTTGGLNLTGDLTATTGVELKADTFITQSAGATITAATLRAQADGDIILNQANDLDSITLLYSDLGDVTYVDVDGFSLDGSSLGDFWTSGTFTLTAGGTGGITQSGAALRAGTLLITAGGNVTLDLANRIDVLGDSSVGGSVFQVVNLGDLEVAGDISVAGALGGLDLTSQTGKVEQTSGEIDAYTVGGASAGDFILTSFTGSLGDIDSTAGDIDVSNAGDIFLLGVLETSAANSVTLTSTTAGVWHSIGRIETGTLNLSAATTIALDGAQGNDIDRLGTVSAYSNFTFADDDGFDLTDDIDVTMIGGTVGLKSNSGAITQSDGVITAYGLNLQAVTGLDLTSANLVSQLNLTNSGTGDVYVFNGQTISVGQATNLGGLVEIGTMAGDILVTTGIEAGSIRLISAADVAVSGELEATGDIFVDATNGDVDIRAIVVGDDAIVQAANGSARVRNVTLFETSDNETNGQNLIIASGTGDAILGAGDEASIGVGDTLTRVSGSGGVFVSSLGGDAGVFLSSAGDKIDTLSADGTASMVITSGNANAGNVTGYNVLLKAAAGGVFADNVTVNGGDYTLYGQFFSTAARSISGTARDISITDTQGGLELIDNIIAQRNLTITVTGDLVDGTDSVGLGAGADLTTGGNLAITANRLYMSTIGANGDVTVNVGATGQINVLDMVLVNGDYTLTGGSFSNAALTPLGYTAGTWTINAGLDLDFSGVAELFYNGSIVINGAGDLTGADIESALGSVSISGDEITLGSVWADGEINLAADPAYGLSLYLAESVSGGVTLSGANVTATGGLFAAGDVLVEALAGTADVLAATAGGDITVSAVDGDAILGAAELGAEGNLTVSAINGDVVFGVLNGSTISSSNTFTRTAGFARGFGILAAGTTSFTSDTGDVTLNLYSTEHIDLIEAALDAEIYVETGDVSIGVLRSIGGEAYAEAGGGALTIDSAMADTGFLALYSTGGDLTVTTGAYGAAGIEFETDGLLDLSLATVDTAGDMDLLGGDVLAGELTADGYISVGAGTGDAHVEFAEAGGGVQVVAIDGDATLRGAEAVDGIAVFAFGTATFGADTRDLITSLNRGIVTGGCGCGAGFLTVLSYGGDAVVNLQTVTGVFDVIGAAETGDVNVVLNSGNLTIGDLAGYNIDVAVENGTLETGYDDTSLYGVFLSGGNYSVKAQDFLGNALTPTLTNGTLNNYTLVDTAGGLDMTSIAVVAQGDILIDVRGVGSALIGDATLTAGDGAGAGNVTVKAAAIALDSVEAEGDVDLNASAGLVDVATSVTVGGDYTLNGRDFSTAALTPLGAKAGDLTITDTQGAFDYSGGDLSYGGDIVISAMLGLTTGGDITSDNGSIEIQGHAIDVGALSAGGDEALAYAYGGDVSVASATAKVKIDLYTSDGDASLGAAALTGAGDNTLLVRAVGVGGNTTFGAALESGITAANTFTSAGSTTNASITSQGDTVVHLDTSDDLTSVSGANNAALVVRGGSLHVGSIEGYAGDVHVKGPTGGLTLGLLSAGDGAEIFGADVTLGGGLVGGDLSFDVTGDIALSGATNLTVTGDITLVADGGITQTTGSVKAGALTVDAGEAVSLLGNNDIEALGEIDVATGGFTYRSTRTGGFGIAGSIDAAGQTVDLRALNGGISQSGGIITAQRLIGTSEGGVSLSRANQIVELGAFANGGGAFLLNVDRALSVVGLVTSDSNIRIQSDGMSIAATGTVSSTATGTAVVLASDGAFANLSGADGVQAANGRWLIYTQAPGAPTTPATGNSFGGLAGKSFYGSAYDFTTGAFSTTPNAGNRFVYAYRPTLTVAPATQTLTYNRQIPTLSALITGLINGDLAADAWSGAPILSGNTSKNVGTYNLIAALGTLASDMNYAFSFGAGTLTINPKALAGTVNANDRTYDRTTVATGSISLNGVITGDTVTAAAIAYSFANKNAGADKVVTAHDVTLGGGDAGNYILSPVGTGLADISKLAIQATVTANDKTYDRTTDATGAITLGGVLVGDDLSISGDLDFANRNAGIGKTVTASNVVLSGADLANYDVTVLTDVADILRKSISGTFTANDKTYDGTATATGSITLTGVITGDTVGAGGTYGFANKTAGLNKTVTATGITLSGADAANYQLDPVATAVADILRKSLTGVLNANDRTYDGTATATGSISLTGVVAGDMVTAGGTYGFANKTAGLNKTVTATGVTLAGADAANYDLGPLATAVADILRKTLTGTFTANDKTYDGASTASGLITLAGLIAGDTVSAGGTYSFANRNAGLNKTVTATGVTLAGADAANYQLDPVATAVADILRKAIVATVVANNKTYNGNATATGAITLGGVIAGDNIGITGNLAFADKNAGANKVVTATGVVISGADAGNYSVTTTTDLADILRKSLTGTFTANNKTYDGTAVATGAISLTGVIAGDSVAAGGTYAFGNKNAGANKVVTASGVTLTGLDSNNYSLSPISADTADIFRKAISGVVVANNRIYDRTTDATGTITLTGVILGDSLSISGDLDFADKNAGLGKTVTASNVVVSGADAGNYIVTTTADLADIARKSVTGVITANSKTYDGTTAATGTVVMGGGVIAGDDFSMTADLAFADKNAGTGKTVTVANVVASGADAGNYEVVSSVATADIFRKSITGAFTANDKTYDGAITATGIVSLTGLITGDKVTAGGVYAFANKNAGVGKLVTASGVTLAGLDSGNYTLTSVNGSDTADIFRKAITGLVIANNRTYDGTTDATGTITLTGVILGDDIGITGDLDFANKNAGLGKTVTASNVVVSGADAGNYAVTTSIDTADIARKAISGVFTANDKTYDGTATAAGSIGLTGVIAGDSVTAGGAYAFTDRNAGLNKTVTASGVALTGADAGNYQLDPLATAVADILRKSLTGVLAASDKTYDGTTVATGAISLTGVIAGDSVAAGGTYAFANKNAGVGKTVTATGVALSGADAANYDLSPLATAVADILRRSITATIAANDKTYDGATDATGSLTLTGVIAGDDLAVAGDLDFADRNAGLSKTVTASNLVLSGADSGNYEVSAAAAIADILRKSLSGVLTANDKTYDGTTAAIGSISLTGVIAGDTVSAGGTYTFADKSAGLNKTVTASGVTLSGADAGNYTLDPLATAIADILRKSLGGVLAVNDKTYDGATTATGSVTLTGVIAGDDVTAGGTYAFADKNAGTGKTVTASGVALAGADAANYDLGPLAAAVADILRREISGTVTASNKTYDGTTDASGLITLTGVLAGDDLTVTGDLDFASKNAGTGKAVTASNLLFSGADAGNYTVTTTAGVADILRKSISGSFTANDKTYDGNTIATGSISLTGVIGGDTVSAGGTYSFADRNAGVDKTVTVSGVTLSGADAGNYDLVTLPASALADILRRSVTVAADDLFKIIGTSEPTLTYHITVGDLVAGDAFTGGLARATGETIGDYTIGQGTLALSDNYSLTFVPGVFTIHPMPFAGQDASDYLKYLRKPRGFDLNWDPSEYLNDGDGQDCIDPVVCTTLTELEQAPATGASMASLGWRRFLVAAKSRLGGVSVD